MRVLSVDAENFRNIGTLHMEPHPDLNLILGKLFGVTGIVLATIISFTCIYFYGSSFVFTKYFKNGKLVKFYLVNLYGRPRVCTAGVTPADDGKHPAGRQIEHCRKTVIII